MLLYKYVPLELGGQIIKNNRVCFSLSENFNDPFDKPRYPRANRASAAGDLFGPLQTMGKEIVWKAMTGILSLTRTPANALMWAHYAKGHTGMVIGFDAVASGFTDEGSNLIPAQFGSVIYVSRRPTTPFIGKSDTPLKVGETHHFPVEHYEKLQRIFLHKSTHWSYEEEVRVVKCLADQSGKGGVTPSGTFENEFTEDSRYHFFVLPKGGIKEIYFGLNADWDISDGIFSYAKDHHPGIKAFECVLNDSELTVGFEPYSTQAEAANP